MATHLIINKDEVASWKYMKLDEIAADIKSHPQNYTEWFKITFDSLVSHMKQLDQR